MKKIFLLFLTIAIFLFCCNQITIKTSDTYGGFAGGNLGCASGENQEQCPPPCHDSYILGPNGLCVSTCSSDSDCPLHKKYGEKCFSRVGLCGFACVGDIGCEYFGYSCLENLGVCGIVKESDITGHIIEIKP